MIKNLVLILTLALGIKVCNAQVKYKMFVGKGNSGQFRLNIIPITYDSTVSDITMLQYVDSLPAGLFHSKMYNVLFTGDSTHLAIQITEGTYLFHTRYTVTEYYKNGNKKRDTYYTKHLKKYWTFNYYADASPMFTGKYNSSIKATKGYAATPDYKGEVKKGKWSYYNSDGNLVKIEKYSHDGTMTFTKEFTPPKHTLTTTLNPKHPKGLPYVIQ
ncbi:MAG TPA: hypothetical protein VK783_05825 [Bacteroidia bacterium]|nr:hypothetical protein [Bacteroidia bacterium]